MTTVLPQLYIVFATLPEHRNPIVVRQGVDRAEAERMVSILCRVAKEWTLNEPLRINDAWHYVSTDFNVHMTKLCWIEPMTPADTTSLQTFNRIETHAGGGEPAIIYQLKRNVDFMIWAYRDGILIEGGKTIAPDIWEIVLRDNTYLATKYGFTPDELRELRGLWTDFECVYSKAVD